MLKNTIQIGEAAQRTALTVDTIRFYERRALLPTAPRTADQFRLYTADDIIRLNFIKQMQGLGFSLQQIKQLLELRDRGRYACEEVSNLLNDKLTEIRGKIRALQELESELAIDLRKQSGAQGETIPRAETMSCPHRFGGSEITPMLIEVLFVPGCPHHKPAVEGSRRCYAPRQSTRRFRKSP